MAKEITTTRVDLNDQGDGTWESAEVSSGGTVVSLLSVDATLSGAGRVGFYINYSESSDSTGPVTHKFRVWRTGGTSGAMTVNYASSGDQHQSVSGELTFADGKLEVKEIQVAVAAQDLTDHLADGLGMHRIQLTLSSPSIGVLHRGSHTIARGVINNSTMIASDANAVFYNSAAAGGGDGTQASPYNNIYTAISNVGSKRYLYLRGTHAPDGTNTGSPYSGTQKCVFAPAGRANEAARLYIQAWPGYTFSLDGGADTDSFGFFAALNASKGYHTYCDLTITNLDCTTQTGQPGGGIWYHYGNGGGVNVERCTISNINGEENNAAVALYGMDGGNVWACNLTSIAHTGSTTNANTSGVNSYDGKNISVQRCYFNDVDAGIFQKRIETLGDVSMGSAFNFYDVCRAHYGASGSSGAGHSGLVVHSDYYKGDLVPDNTDGGRNDGFYHGTTNAEAVGDDNWVSNCVFYKSGKDLNAAMRTRMLGGLVLLNSIFLDSRMVYSDEQNDSPSVEWTLTDYNHYHGITYTNPWEWRGTYYSTASALGTATNSAYGVSFEANSSTGDPLLTDADNDDLTLGESSPCDATGIGGTDKGFYLLGVEILGPTGLQT